MSKKAITADKSPKSEAADVSAKAAADGVKFEPSKKKDLRSEAMDAGGGAHRQTTKHQGEETEA